MSTDEIRLRCDGKTQSRTGKIARLPYKIREEVNRRLRDNVPGDIICEWLNRLPAAKKVCNEFARRSGKEQSPITPNQLSEWRRGGFRDWLNTQQMLEETREMTEWSVKLAKDSGGDLSEAAAVLLSGQLLKVLRGMAGFGKFHPPSSDFGATRVPSSKFQDRIDEPPEPFARENCEAGELNKAPDNAALAAACSGGDPSSQTYDATDARAAISGEAERMESSVRLLASLVKCLSGIRRGDQNRVRLALAEKKVELRSKVVAIECEKYKKEKTAQEKLERKQRADERRKKSGLSEKGKINLLRGRLFGPEGVIKEKEDELKRLQKDLKILKEKFGMSTDPEESDVHPPSSDFGATTAQRSEDGGSKVEDSSQAAPAKAGSQKCAPNGAEPMSVNPSPSDQSGVKENGGLKMDGGAHPAPAKADPPNDATGWREEASAFGTLRRDEKGQGAEKFDVRAALREVQQIKEELAALQVGLPAGESSLGQSQEQNNVVGEPETNSSTEKSDVAEAERSKNFENENENEGDHGESEPEFSSLSWEEQTLWLEKFPEVAIRKLEEIKQEVAKLKARRQASSSVVSREEGGADGGAETSFSTQRREDAKTQGLMDFEVENDQPPDFGATKEDGK